MRAPTQARLRLLFDFGGSGFDRAPRPLRAGNIDGMATCLIDGLRAGALGHHPLRADEDHLVVGRREVSAGFLFQAGSETAPFKASSPQGTWESAMKAARSGFTSAANDAAFSPVQEQEAILRREDRRHRRTRRKVGNQRCDQLALIGRERRHVHQSSHFRVGAGLGNHNAAVGCPTRMTGFV